jgi:type II secretory pathway pseudopilin PulG
MMRRYLVFVGLAALAVLPLALRAQSLADVARAEEARRKTVKQAAKVYTNDDLKPSNEPLPVPGSAQTAAVPGSTSPASAPSPAPVAGDPKRDEKLWKDRMTLVRDAVTHDKVLLDAVQSQINALTTEFVNTSDPAQRAVVEGRRKTALAELDRLNKDLQAQTRAISDIQEEARKAGVPAGWLR